MEKITEKSKKTIAADKVNSGYDMIITVIARGFSDYVISAARDAGATGATILYARGTADVDKQVMGISLQPEREVVLTLVKTSERRKIMQAINEGTSLLEEGRGLCFSMPVSEVFGLKRVAEQKKEQIRKAKELAKAQGQKAKKKVSKASKSDTAIQK